MILVLTLISLFQSTAQSAPKVEFPKDNAQSVQKIELGKQLYFDPRLSRSGATSCNSCHNVMAGGDDDSSLSVGHKGQLGGRNAPTVWNSMFNTVQFWDGRAVSLEEQAKGPLLNPVEMAMDSHDVVMNRVKAFPQYVEAFTKVFGKNNPMTIDNLARAIASFERTLVAYNSPYDKYLAGNKKALSAGAVKGLKLVEEIGCLACHAGSNFNGNNMVKMGEGFYQKFPTFPDADIEKKYDISSDLGRFQVTKNEDDKNMWRVPTWRNVEITAPYFHNGKVKTLREAVRVMGKVQLDRVLKEDEITSIVAFLNSLTGELPKITQPKLPEISGATVLQD
ncbi:MAG: cytochrome-c peroxidase [Bacteriovoracaceae bacterium]